MLSKQINIYNIEQAQAETSQMRKVMVKFIFPLIYGLLIYFTIRLLHDIDVREKFWERPLLLNAIEIISSILLGYLSIYLFKQLFLVYNKRWPVSLSYVRIIGEVAMIIVVALLVANLILTPVATFTGDGLSWEDIVDINVIPVLYAIIYYGVTKSGAYFKAYINKRLELEQVVNEHLISELKFLKAQYHPHFLFNALNTIYFQMDDDITGAKNTIEKFSELLRYQLYDQQQQIEVSKEIEYLNNFIALQKVRSSDKLNLQVHFGDELQMQLVYPLLFLPLVENAFKYVGGKFQIIIDAKLTGDFVEFTVENSLSDFHNEQKNTTGIGLENLRRRLSLLYPDQHYLKVHQTKEIFTATLGIHYYE